MPPVITNDKILLSAEVRLAVFLVLIVGCLVIVSSKINKVKPPETVIPNISMREISHGDRSKKQVIFTFDGGDRNLSGEKILEVLNKYGIKSSFFLTGKFVENNPVFVKNLQKAGHQIHNHSYDHPHLTDLSNEEIINQLNKMESVLIRTIGISPKPYFRAPYGNRDQRVLKTAFLTGYQSVYWTIDAMDWQESEGRTNWDVKNNILSNLAPGNIYLMHLGDTIIGSVLDELIVEIKNRGYNIVSLTQGL